MATKMATKIQAVLSLTTWCNTGALPLLNTYERKHQHLALTCTHSVCRLRTNLRIHNAGAAERQQWFVVSRLHLVPPPPCRRQLRHRCRGHCCCHSRTGQGGTGASAGAIPLLTTCRWDVCGRMFRAGQSEVSGKRRAGLEGIGAAALYSHAVVEHSALLMALRLQPDLRRRLPGAELTVNSFKDTAHDRQR